MNNFILKGDICYSTDKTTIRTVKDGYAVCESGISKGVFKNLPQEYSDYEIFDYSGKLVLPSMVDLHTHAPQFAFCGLNMDSELIEWLNNSAFKEEAKYSDITYAEKAYSIFADALKSSVTTRACIFATLHSDATKLLMEQLEKSGLASYVGKVNMDRNSPCNLCEQSAEKSAQDTIKWINETLDKYENTKPILTPRFIPSCSDELMRKLSTIQQKYNLPIQSHLSENKDEIKWVQELCPYSKSYGDAYDRFSLFGKSAKTIMAHCVYSNDDEVELMKRNGVFIAHCSASNTNLSSGIAPARRYIDNNLKIGLGSDMAGGHSISLFRAIADTVQVSKLYYRLVDNNTKPVTFNEAFYLATIGGGEFFGDVGSFENGYEFDAVVIDDSVLPHPQELDIHERLERAVYLNADFKGIISKFVKGKKII